MSDAPSLSPRSSGGKESDDAVRRGLVVSLFGGATFTFDGREIVLRNRKARAMIGYLALTERGEEQRERIAGLFWSESPEANARATLRQAVHEARETMLAAGCGALLSERTTIGLQPGSFTVDVETALRSLTAGEIPEALRQPQAAEALLAGFEDLDPAFHGWLTARRQTLHDRIMRVLEQGYRDLALQRRRRRRLAEAALLLDPTHEEACRVVMRCAAEDGEIGGALHAYDALYRLLGDEYDMEPSAPTLDLVAEIKQGKFDGFASREASAQSLRDEVAQILVEQHPSRAGAPPPAPPPPKPVLVIAPFDIHGVEPDRVHLVEGFRLELIACLVRFREWYVTDTQARAADTPAGAPVSMRYRVTTTTYQAGSAISAVMVLQDETSGVVIWSDRFEVRLDSWAATQQRVVRRLASTLSVELSTERLARVAAMPEVSLEAHDVWLRAQLLIMRFTPENWNGAAQMLAQAIERAPTFSPLYSSLVQMNNTFHIAHPGMFRAAHKEERTLGLAQQAVRLDPRDSRAELSLGWALTMSKRYGQAETHMEIACELNPYDAWTLIAAGMFHSFIGNRSRAEDLSAQAMELTLSPSFAQWIYLATTRYLCGDDEGLLVASGHAHALTPEPYPWRTAALNNLFAWRAAAMWNLGRKEEAREEARRFLELTRANWFGPSPPADAMIGRWLLHIYPISDPEVWRRLHAGVTAAGIPDGGMTHHGW